MPSMGEGTCRFVPQLRQVYQGAVKGVASTQDTKETGVQPNDQTIGSIRHDESRLYRVWNRK
jgi:phage tail sheath protein FI